MNNTIKNRVANAEAKLKISKPFKWDRSNLTDRENRIVDIVEAQTRHNIVQSIGLFRKMYPDYTADLSYDIASDYWKIYEDFCSELNALLDKQYIEPAHNFIAIIIEFIQPKPRVKLCEA